MSIASRRLCTLGLLSIVANAADPDALPVEAPSEKEVPAEIRALEQSLNQGVDPDMPAALYEPEEPGGTLKPSDRFARVPIRPQMSDANWRRWAGPMLEKSYRIHRSDTLWGVSERFFGNPYLWPKVWQLNAQIANPHVISAGLDLAFVPGGPNSAPALAFKNYPGMDTDDLPVLSSTRKLSLMEFLDENLRAQILSSHPPFQFFLLDTKPAEIARMPKPENPLRIFHDEGDSFAAPDLADGDYEVIRTRSTGEAVGGAQRVRWIGTIRVKERRGTVWRAFSEIAKDDVITSKHFALSPLALHESRLGLDERERTKLVPVQEGYENLVSENMLTGLRFAGIDRGPRAGALLTVLQGQKKIATLLVIDRDHLHGTAWIVEAVRELDPSTDRID